jgi:hypothetical protein
MTTAAPADAAAAIARPEEGPAHDSHGTCRNCGTVLLGRHCHVCGQDSHVARTLLHLLEELVHGITHFDGKTLRSLPMLFFRPGTLTHNYIHGKRARYVPPFAMFLFSVFAMFLVFALTGGPGFFNVNDAAPLTREEAVRQAETQLADARGEVAPARAELAQAEQQLAALAPDASPGERAGAETAVTTARVAVDNAVRAETLAQEGLERARQLPLEGADPSGQPSITVTRDQRVQDAAEALAEIDRNLAEARAKGDQAEIVAFEIARRTALAAQEAAQSGATLKSDAPADDAASKQTGTGGTTTFSEAFKKQLAEGIQINTPWRGINEAITKKVKNPDLFLYKIQNTAYKFSFLLIPLSLPFLWVLLFWKRGITLYDHGVFSLYSLSFMSLMLILLSLAARWIPAFPTAAVLLAVPPLHLFFQFKGAYALGWFAAAWRTLVFCVLFAWWVVALFLLAVIALGVID